jgi:hypothetical protein
MNADSEHQVPVGSHPSQRPNSQQLGGAVQILHQFILTDLCVI